MVCGAHSFVRGRIGAVDLSQSTLVCLYGRPLSLDAAAGWASLAAASGHDSTQLVVV